MKTTFITLLAAASILSGAAIADSFKEDAGNAAHQVKDAVVGSSIANIGTSGNVTVSGTVSAIDTIDNEFTLEDASGAIDVEQSSEAKMKVSVGDKVTVSGAVAEDMGEKEISATKVSVTERISDTN